jgi:citronellol/citronellal dehydrogenase
LTHFWQADKFETFRSQEGVNPMKLDGKVAVITGSSRGIGKQIALTFAKHGAKIAVVARTEKEGTSKLPGTIHQTIEEIRALGGTAIPVRTDITLDADIENMAKRVLEEWGQVDILMTSIAAKRQAPPGEVCYSITKVGIEYFAWGLAQEVKPYNIAVNDLYPTGGVTTDGFKRVFAKHNLSDDILERMKTPEQIAEAALWLAQQTAETFTGHSVNDDEVRALSEKSNQES